MLTRFPNMEAKFDCLLIGSRLTRLNGTFTPSGIHLFGYLACLLSIYKQYNASDWGYGFIGTELGAPFSMELSRAIEESLKLGYFHRSEQRLVATRFADDMLSDFLPLTFTKNRVECVGAACASTAGLSVGMVWHALSNEPDLSRAHTTPANRPLLENGAQHQLYSQFSTLRSALQNRGGDLRVPAMVWLTSLYRLGESQAFSS